MTGGRGSTHEWRDRRAKPARRDELNASAEIRAPLRTRNTKRVKNSRSKAALSGSSEDYALSALLRHEASQILPYPATKRQIRFRQTLRGGRQAPSVQKASEESPPAPPQQRVYSSADQLSRGSSPARGLKLSLREGGRVLRRSGTRLPDPRCPRRSCRVGAPFENPVGESRQKNAGEFAFGAYLHALTRQPPICPTVRIPYAGILTKA